MRLFLVAFLALVGLSGTAPAQEPTYDSRNIQFSILPSARSVQTGQTATVFGTALGQTVDMSDCELVLGAGGAGRTLSWRLLDGNNQPTADAENATFSLNAANGRRQNLLIAITSPSAGDTTDVTIIVRCPAPSLPSTDFYANTIYPGVNTLALTVSDTPRPDIIVIGSSLTSDGYVRLPSPGARRPAAISAVNIGAAANVEVSANTGAYDLPVTLEVCETNASGVCTSARAERLTVNFAQNEVRTFNVYVQSNGQRGVPDLPGIARAYFNFAPVPAATDPGLSAPSAGPQYTTRYGTTSFAVLAAGPEQPDSAIAGVYRGLIAGGRGGPAGSVPALIVLPNATSTVIYTQQSDAAGWGSTSQGPIFAPNANGARQVQQNATTYANGLRSSRTPGGGLVLNRGFIFPRAGMTGNVSDITGGNAASFSYQAVYDPIAEQTISGNLTPDGTAIVGQTFDIFYQGVDIGDLQTGETTPNGSSVGSATVTYPGQSAPCNVAVVNQRMSTELTTWRFSFGNFEGCPVPRYEGGGYVDDTQGARRVYLTIFALETVDNAVDTFPLILVARQ